MNLNEPEVPPVERTLLLVDDEKNILRALSRVVRRDEYRILLANSGQEGLELLAQHPVGVIVSDQRMPQMTGVEFLSRVKDLYPATVRIVLSGYTELESVTDAINDGAIFKFFTKPWDDTLLRRHIREAFEHQEMAQENQRLTAELKMANQQLSSVNQELEYRVQLKTREALLNVRALTVSQEVLERLPVGVLGVDSEGMVVVSNQLAQTLLNPTGNSLIGTDVGTTLPHAIVEVIASYHGCTAARPRRVVSCHGQICDLAVALLDHENPERGLVLVLAPQRGIGR